MLWISVATMGLCVAGASWAAQGMFGRFLDFVEADLAQRLRILRISNRQLRRWIQLWLVVLVVAFFSLWLGFDMLVFALLAAVFLSAGPWYFVRRLAQQREQKIEDQLADAMVMFSSAVRAGLSLPQALKLLAEECPRPIHQEFQQIVGEYNLGKPLERTLTEAKERLRSENFVLFSAALLASRSSGGRLNETVERISKSVLELQRLERKLLSETAQARKSAVYMSIIPAIILVVYSYVDPENTQALFMTFPGQILLAAAILLNVIAYLWALKILRADI